MFHFVMDKPHVNMIILNVDITELESYNDLNYVS